MLRICWRRIPTMLRSRAALNKMLGDQRNTWLIFSQSSHIKHRKRWLVSTVQPLQCVKACGYKVNSRQTPSDLAVGESGRRRLFSGYYRLFSVVRDAGSHKRPQFHPYYEQLIVAIWSLCLVSQSGVYLVSWCRLSGMSFRWASRLCW